MFSDCAVLMLLRRHYQLSHVPTIVTLLCFVFEHHQAASVIFRADFNARFPCMIPLSSDHLPSLPSGEALLLLSVARALLTHVIV
jgi:hypothetical protein